MKEAELERGRRQMCTRSAGTMQVCWLRVPPIAKPHQLTGANQSHWAWQADNQDGSSQSRPIRKSPRLIAIHRRPLTTHCYFNCLYAPRIGAPRERKVASQLARSQRCGPDLNSSSEEQPTDDEDLVARPRHCRRKRTAVSKKATRRKRTRSRPLFAAEVTPPQPWPDNDAVPKQKGIHPCSQHIGVIGAHR